MATDWFFIMMINLINAIRKELNLSIIQYFVLDLIFYNQRESISNEEISNRMDIPENEVENIRNYLIETNYISPDGYVKNWVGDIIIGIKHEKPEYPNGSDYVRDVLYKKLIDNQYPVVKEYRVKNSIIDLFLEPNIGVECKNIKNKNINDILKKPTSQLLKYYEQFDHLFWVYSEERIDDAVKQIMTFVDTGEVGDLYISERLEKYNSDRKLKRELKDIFIDDYWDLKNEKFYWEIKHASALKSILLKIRFAYKNRGNIQPSDEQIKNAFIHLLQKAKQISWISDKYDIAIINSQWNIIISKRNGNKTHQAAREFLNQKD